VKRIFRKEKTWKFSAKTRDFGIATKIHLDAMAVQLNNKTVMAISVYPKKVIHGRNFYRTVAYFKSYSAHTFDYPYPKRYQYQQKIKEWNIHDLLELRSS
jgi:hypothetical protein